MKDRKPIVVDEATDLGPAKPDTPGLTVNEATTLLQLIRCLQALAAPDTEDILRQKIGNSFNVGIFDLFIVEKKLQQIVDIGKEIQRMNEVGTIVDMLVQPQAMPTEETL